MGSGLEISLSSSAGGQVNKPGKRGKRGYRVPSYRVCRVYWVYRKIKGKGWRKKEWPFDLEQHGCYDFA